MFQASLPARPDGAADTTTPAPASPDPDAHSEPVGDRAQVWVLVVEDDAETRAVMGAALEDAGYVVAEAPDGMAAIEVLRVSPYPIVALLDYWMPRVDGAAVLAAVAADPVLATRHAYVVVTATPDILPPAFAAQLVTLHVPVLAKPFEIDELVAVVARAVERITHHPDH